MPRTLDYETPDLPLKTAGDFRAALIDYVGLLLALVLEIVVFSLISAHQGRAFFSPDTFRTIINELPAGAIMTVGMTYVLMIGGIDLSVGSVMGLSSAVVGVLMVQHRVALPLAMAAGIGAGVVCGLINGLISVGWRLPSFIVTLGMLEIARGMIHVVTQSHTQYVGDAIGKVASVSIGGLSLLFFIAAIIVIAGQVVLQRTVFGRYVTAIGNNELAVRYSGVNPGPTKTLVYILCGLLAGIAGVVEVARIESANPNGGTGKELEIIAAVVVGGTSLSGGRGSVFRGFLGLLIMEVLGNGLAAVDVQDEQKRLVTGSVIILAVLLDYYRRGGKRA